ncbi:hypothetical protein UlMin_026989 [Ulmus minor]
MHLAFIAKNKFSFVDGTISKLDVDDLSYRTWSRCNNIVISWIIHAVSKEIVESIMYIDKACDVWADLHELFHQSNGPRIFQIKQQLSSLSQGSSDVSAQILMIDPLPLMNRIFFLVIQEERQRGLSSSNHFPSISSSNSAAFGVATSNYNSYKGKCDKPLCTHCGFLGHTIEKCYKIHGYPLGLRKKFSY